jgi:hypothetical protein
MVCFKELPFPQGTLDDLGGMFPFAGQSQVIVHNHPVIDINNAHQVEKPVFPGNITILDINFPELVGSGNLAVIGQALGMLNLDTPLWRQYIQFFAESVDFFVVDYQVVLSAQADGQFAVSIYIFFSGNQFH